MYALRSIGCSLLAVPLILLAVPVLVLGTYVFVIEWRGPQMVLGRTGARYATYDELTSVLHKCGVDDPLVLHESGIFLDQGWYWQYVSTDPLLDHRVACLNRELGRIDALASYTNG